MTDRAEALQASLQALGLRTMAERVGDLALKAARAQLSHEAFLYEVVRVELEVREQRRYARRLKESHLPREIMYRRKQGFAVPLASWFRGPLRSCVRAALLGETLAETGFFNRAVLAHIVEQHESGVRDYSASIWSLLMFEAFLRRILGAASTTGGERHSTMAPARPVAA